jgi:hypothetical protein
VRIPVRPLLIVSLLGGAAAALFKLTRPAPPRPAVPAGAPDPFPFRPIERPAPAADAAWVDPLDGGACPLTHPVKANAQSQIFHVPGGLSYDRTRAERCYRSPADAEADGFRAAKR